MLKRLSLDKGKRKKKKKEEVANVSLLTEGTLVVWSISNTWTENGPIL